MPDELSRALGMEGGGFPVWVKEYQKNPDGSLVLDPDGKPIVLKETEWILSDLSKHLQARHVAWMKGRLRREKQMQKEEGVITDGEYKEEIAYLDELFAMGEYSFGKPRWQNCVKTNDGAAKLFQLLLEKEHPNTKEWSLDQMQDLIAANDEGFTAAMRDILPKAMGKKPATEAANSTPSSK